MDVRTIGLDADVCKMGVETGFIKLGVSGLVGDLCDMSLAHLGLSIMGLLGELINPRNLPGGARHRGMSICSLLHVPAALAFLPREGT